MLPIAIVMAALSVGSVFLGTDEPNRQAGDRAARDAIQLMIGSSSMELAVDHGAVTVRHGVLSPATDDLSDAALLQLYAACKSSWVGSVSLSLSGRSPQSDTVRDKEGERLAPSMVTVTDFLENKILARARMEDLLMWSPQQRQEQVRKAVIRIGGVTK
jgi:hypothetical protein